MNTNKCIIMLLYIVLIINLSNSVYGQSGEKKSENYRSPDITWGIAGNIPCGETDFMTSTVSTGVFRSLSTQPHQPGWPNAARIWAAATQYSSAGPDTCKFFYSDNGGQSWVYAYFFYFSPIVDFRPGELDIELVYDGSAVWIYGTAGYNNLTLNRTISMFFRINTSSNTFFSGDLFFPGFFTATNMYYNPRITSDNSVYGAGAKIMFTCSFDSSNGEDHYLTSKFCKITNPFTASPTLTTTMPNGGRFFFFNYPEIPNIYLWSDIAYTRSGTNDRIIIVYNCTSPSDNNINLMWSDDYGSTVAGNMRLSEDQPNYGAKIAFNGGAGNFTGMIAYVRQSPTGNWDAYNYSTSNSGVNWTQGIIDNSTGRVRSVDLTALLNVNNKFKIAYTQDSTIGTVGFYTGGSPGAFNQPSKMLITIPGIDTSGSRIIAGYRSNIADDCFTLYSKSQGTDVIASRLCLSTVGVNVNNSIPEGYCLSQNYPNPFNPETKIRFSIPKSTYVKLVIYDASGKKVETLANTVLEAGIYNYEFNAAGLASGVYFYRLEAEGFEEIKRMVLLK